MSEVTLNKNLPVAADFNDDMDALAGQEQMTQGSLALPFLSMLQKGSPQCSKANGAYIKGAEEGMFMNTVNGELYPGDPGVVVVPCYYREAIVEWKVRESGGGYVAEHPMDAVFKTQRDEKNRDIRVDNGNEVIPTQYHYCLLVRDLGAGDTVPVVVTAAKTFIKNSRKWNTDKRDKKLDGKFQPMLRQLWRLSQFGRQKDQDTWMVWQVTFEGFLQHAEQGAKIYMAAKDFYNGLKLGTIKEDASKQRGAEAEVDADPEVSF